MATATRTALRELTDHVQQTYGVPALQTRILVSTYLATRYMPLWILIDAEKCRFLEDLEYAVQKMGHSAILDTWYLRRERTFLVNRYVMILVTAREKPQLFANRYWDWPGPAINKRSYYPLVATECLRLRLEFDASKQPGSLAAEGLYQLMSRALGEAAVDRGGIVPIPLDEVFYRRASLLQLVDRHLTSPTALMRNFGFVLANHAALSGRAQPNEEDRQVQRYMMRHTIPVWAEKVVRVLLKRGSRAIGWRELVRQTGQAYEWQWRYGGSNMSRPQQLGERIIREFFMSGLVEQNKSGRYTLKPQYADDLEHILEARA